MKTIFLFIIFPIDAALGVLLTLLLKTVFIKRDALYRYPRKMLLLIIISLILLGSSLLIHIRFAPEYTNIGYFAVIGIIALLSSFRKM